MLRTPTLQALAAIALWGVLALLALRLSRMPPFLLVGVGLLIGSLCSVHKLREWRVPPTTLLLGIYGLFGFHFCLFMALRYAPPVEANLINYLWPLLIVALAPVFLPGHRLRPQHIAGALLGFAGAVLIVTGGTFGFRVEH
jgi:drug/metabolite transporter (DMT)-like permease